MNFGHFERGDYVLYEGVLCIVDNTSNTWQQHVPISELGSDMGHAPAKAKLIKLNKEDNPEYYL